MIEMLGRVRHGPDLIVCIMNTHSILFWHGIGGGVPSRQYERRETQSTITTSIMTAVQACAIESTNTSCFFVASNGACEYEIVYRPQPGTPLEVLKFCMTPSATYSCDKADQCVTACNSITDRVETRPCSVTRGNRVKYTRPRNPNNDKYLQNCPEKEEPCGSPCPPQPPGPSPSTSTSTTTEKGTTPTPRRTTTPFPRPTSRKKSSTTDNDTETSAGSTQEATKPTDEGLSTVEIVLILVDILALIIAIIICIILYICCKKEERDRS